MSPAKREEFLIKSKKTDFSPHIYKPKKGGVL